VNVTVLVSHFSIFFNKNN